MNMIKYMRGWSQENESKPSNAAGLTGNRVIHHRTDWIQWWLLAWASGLSPQMSFSRFPHRETYWSRIWKRFVRNFQILIVSVVKICKQCLQSCFSFWGMKTPTGASPLDLTGGLWSPRPTEL